MSDINKNFQSLYDYNVMLRERLVSAQCMLQSLTMKASSSGAENEKTAPQSNTNKWKERWKLPKVLKFLSVSDECVMTCFECVLGKQNILECIHGFALNGILHSFSQHFYDPANYSGLLHMGRAISFITDHSKVCPMCRFIVATFICGSEFTSFSFIVTVFYSFWSCIFLNRVFQKG